MILCTHSTRQLLSAVNIGSKMILVHFAAADDLIWALSIMQGESERKSSWCPIRTGGSGKDSLYLIKLQSLVTMADLSKSGDYLHDFDVSQNMYQYIYSQAI